MAFTDKLTKFLALFLPEPEHEQWENLYYHSMHLVDWVLANHNAGHRLLAGKYNSTSGDLENISVRFVVDGQEEIVDFADTPVVINTKHQVWTASRGTGLITAIDLSDYMEMQVTDDNFPLLHTGHHNISSTTTQEFWREIAPRDPTIEIINRKYDGYDHILGSDSQLQSAGATMKYDGAAEQFKDKDGNTVALQNGDKIHIVGLDTLTEKMTFAADHLKIRTLAGVEIPTGDQGSGEPYPIFITGDHCDVQLWADKTFEELESLASLEDQRFIKNQGYQNRIRINQQQIFRGGMPMSYESPVIIKNPYFLLQNGYSYEAVTRAGANEDMCRFLDLWKFYGGIESLEIAPVFNPFSSSLWEKVFLDDPAGRFTRLAKGPGAAADNDPDIHGRTSPTGSETVDSANYTSGGTNEISGLAAADRKKFKIGCRVYDAGTGIPGPNSGTKKTTVVGSITASSVFLVDSETGADVNVSATGDLTVDMGGNSGLSQQDDAMQGHKHGQKGRSSSGGTEFGSGYALGTANVGQTFNPESDGVNGTPRTASETRSKSIQRYLYILP